MSGIEQLRQPSMQILPLGKVVLGVLLLVKKLGLLMTVRHKRLQTTQVRSAKIGNQGWKLLV
jgi:hypothetical protein